VVVGPFDDIDERVFIYPSISRGDRPGHTPEGIDEA